MQNCTPHRLSRINACRADLLESGIDLSTMSKDAVAAFVREHLEYFQCMLGDDSSASQIVGLLNRKVVPARRLRTIAEPAPIDRTNDAPSYVEARAARLERRRQAMAHMSLDELVAAIGDLRHQAADMAEQMQVVVERLRALHV